MLTLKTHSLDSLRSPGPWPPQISRIYDLLQLPLPQWCSPESSVPGKISISPELDAAAADSSDESEENARLRDFYPFVVHTVDAVNSAMGHDGPQTAWPFVRGFTKVLIATCSENAALLSHASFVLPRLVAPRDDIFDGVAEMLACHIVEGFEEESSRVDDEKSFPSGIASLQACPHVTPASHPSEDASNESMGSDPVEVFMEASVSDHSPTVRSDSFFSASSSALSSNSDQSIDVSLNGHIFYGRGKHSFALLPFLCIADEENIIEVVSSVACQRFVWGISEPAIGFQFSPSGTAMKLVLAWVDSSSRVLHVAHDTDHQSGIGVFVFDFDSIASTLRFTQFLSNLSPSFSAVANSASRLCENIRFDWRLDRPTLSDPKSGVHRISEWVRHVESFSGSPPPRSESPAVHSNSDTEIKATSGSVQSIAPEISDSRTSTESDISSNNDSDDFSLDDMYNPVIESLAYYAADRGVKFLSRLRYPEERFGAEGTEINHHLGLYDELTRFQWFPPEAQLPSLVGALKKHKDALLKDIQCRLDDSLAPPLVVKTEHQTIIAQRIFTLFYASAGGEIPRGRAERISDGFKGRHDWDALLLSFFTAKEQGLVSRNVLFERTIHYPKNQLVEMNGEKLAKAVWDERAWSPLFYFSAQQAAHDQVRSVQPNLGSRSELYIQAQLACAQATQLWDSYLDYCKVDDNKQVPLQPLLRDRSWHEPATGICDALCFFAIPSPTGSDETTWRALEFITRSKADVSTEFALPETASASFKGTLLLPYFIVEYKKQNDTAGKALDRGRLDLMALISYYAALGILDFPFYVLVTNGSKGAILMGWKSTQFERIYIVERNVVQLDISTPIGAYQFAIFLLRLREKQEDLEAKVKAKLVDVNFDPGKFQEWRKEWQAERLDKEWGLAEADRAKAKKAAAANEAAAKEAVANEAEAGAVS
ncbi:hypothetical protein R3P38DRAFT_3251543 [Favolaschia claudopus]|uniref:Uncharacterized protein n=1 Tax=Favolaschia claudopus TaxID=2862362 RepID=A0AAW0EDL1_9AGAR